MVISKVGLKKHIIRQRLFPITIKLIDDETNVLNLHSSL